MSTEELTVGAEARYLSFTAGEEHYAIPLLKVREVIAMPEFTPIPFAPPYFLGIMNLRGQVISVLDLRKKFNLKAQIASETAVIICDLGQISVGVVVDSVDSVLAPKSEDISPRPEVTGSKNADFITGVLRRDQSLVLFVDIARALSLDDLNVAKNATLRPTA